MPFGNHLQTEERKNEHKNRYFRLWQSGRGVEALKQNPDMELKAVLRGVLRKQWKSWTKGVPGALADEAEKMKDED